MKILHISTINEWRGGDAQMLTTYNLLKHKSDLTQFILCPTGSVLAEKCEAQAIPYFTASRKSKFSFPFLMKIINIVKSLDIDVIHVHDSNALSITSVALKFLDDVKLVYSRKRNNPIKNNYFKRLKYNNRHVTKIICVSEAVKSVLTPVVKNPDKIKVIYDGIDVDKFSKNNDAGILRTTYNISENTKIIGNIAGLTRQKDIYTFLDAAKLIIKNFESQVKFIIVGDGHLKADLKAYTDTLGLSQSVVFTGFRNDVPAVLAEFDILMMSSETEGLPLTIYEAFASGVPVVSTNAGGVAEAVLHEETGLVSPVKDAQALAENAMRMLQDDALREGCASNAAQRVYENYTLSVMRENYYNFYISLS